MAPGLKPLDGGVALHIACHARAQNMGQKAAEMLRLIPGADLQVIERCSGHGGSWGVLKGNFETALKVGKPVARSARRLREKVSRLGMPAGRPAYPAGHGKAAVGKTGAGGQPASNRDSGARLRTLKRTDALMAMKHEITRAT